MIVAALRGADELLAALGDPFDRPAESPRRPQHQHPFGIKEILDAEPTPDVGGAHGDAVGRHIEDDFSELLAQAMHPLTGQQQVEAVGGSIVAADRGARLDRGDDQPVVDQLDLDDVGCRREGRIDCRFVAALEPVRQIARRVVPQPRRLLGERFPRVDHRRQWPICHVDSLGGVARLLRRVGHDERHRVANMANPVARQRPARRHDHRRDRRHPGDAWQRPDAVGIEIRSGENAMHPRHRAGDRGVDAFYQRMSVG